MPMVTTQPVLADWAAVQVGPGGYVMFVLAAVREQRLIPSFGKYMLQG